MGRWHDELGATAVEYGLVVGAVGILMVLVGPQLVDGFRAFLGLVLDGMVG